MELKFRLIPGYDVKGVHSIYWDEPVACYIFRRKGRKAKRLALGMSVYLVNDYLHIGQLQGRFGTAVPKELRPWAKRFIESCRDFVRQENLKGVKVAKAASIYSYHNPGLKLDLNNRDRERITNGIQREMKLLYDTNALAAGVIPDGDWYTWKNPV